MELIEAEGNGMHPLLEVGSELLDLVRFEDLGVEKMRESIGEKLVEERDLIGMEEGLAKLLK